MLHSLLLLLPAPALAVDTEFAGAEEQPVEDAETADAPVTTLIAELGGTWTTGNAVFYTINGGVSAAHLWQRNKLSGSAGLSFGAAKVDTDENGALSQAEKDADYVENAKRLAGEIRYDRFVSERGSLYALVGAFTDPFAGYDLRSHEQVGYAHLLVNDEDTQLRGEIGFDVAQENYVDGVDPNTDDIFSGRVLVGLAHKFNESVAFSNVAEYYNNVVDTDDFRFLNTAALTSTLSSKLSLKLSHALTYDNVPVENFGKFDQTTMVTFVATVL